MNEAHIYGYNRNDNILLQGYQRNGRARRKASHDAVQYNNPILLLHKGKRKKKEEL